MTRRRGQKKRSASGTLSLVDFLASYRFPAGALFIVYLLPAPLKNTTTRKGKQLEETIRSGIPHHL
jgi:hypothetical protein